MAQVSLNSVLGQAAPKAAAATPARPSLPSLMSVLSQAPAPKPSPLQQVGAPLPATHGAVDLTERGARKARELMEKEGRDPQTTYLRMGVKGGGCSGLAYTIELTDKPDSHDVKLECHGIHVVVDPKSLVYLSGSRLDWETGLKGHGWQFNNPNEKKGCGCGESFTI